MELGFAHFLAQTDGIAKAVLATLVAMSLASWYLIIVKSLQALTVKRRTSRFLAMFWDAPSLQAVETRLQNHRPDEPFSHLAYHAIVSARHHARHGAESSTRPAPARSSSRGRCGA